MFTRSDNAGDSCNAAGVAPQEPLTADKGPGSLPRGWRKWGFCHLGVNARALPILPCPEASGAMPSHQRIHVATSSKLQYSLGPDHVHRHVFKKKQNLESKLPPEPLGSLRYRLGPFFKILLTRWFCCVEFLLFFYFILLKLD